MPTYVLRRAKENVSHILGHAGVEVAWLDCPLGEQDSEALRLCNQKLGKDSFWIHLVARKLPGADQDSLGTTLLDLLGDRSACVYYHEITMFAKDLNCDIHVLLAATIAHEIGHLLLGESHSRTGIMSAELSPLSLDLAKQGSLLFTSAQIRLIRMGITVPAK